MTLARFTLPEPMDLVPAADVRGIIAAADRDLAALEERASEAEGFADQAEARAAEAGVDGRASTWAMVRMQRFLDGLRAEVDNEIDTMLDVARERARLRIDEARDEARRIRYGASAAAPATVARAPVPAPLAEPPDAVVAEPPPVSEALVFEPIAYDPLVVHAPLATDPPVVVDPPASNGDAADVAPWTPEPIHVMFAQDSDHPAATTLALAEPPTIAAPAVDDAPAVVAAPSEGQFWPEPAPRRRGLRRIPFSAVLEVIAVLLILVFILLRLS